MSDRPPRRPAFEIGGQAVEPRSSRTVRLPVGELPDRSPVDLAVRVVHGKRPGPTLFVSAAMHGDEVLGVEIARRLLRAPSIGRLRGTLLVVPVLNAPGFLAGSRYLPDRRDLNRSFPGSTGGSLASQLARRFLDEVVARSEVGVDLHTAASYRANLPQLRVSETTPEVLELARAFGAPMVLVSPVREGSLRAAARERGVEVLVYEGGEASRLDELAARVGVKGLLGVMKQIGMVARPRIRPTAVEPVVSRASSWVRAPGGGLFRGFRRLGALVERDELLGVISDPVGEREVEVRSTRSGLVIGRSHLPVVHLGDALFHVASVPEGARPGAAMDRISEEVASDPVFDEDEIR